MRNHPGEMHGTLQEGKTEFIARVGDEIIVVRDVPISHLRPVRRGVLQRGSFPKDRCRDEGRPQRQALLPASRGRRGRTHRVRPADPPGRYSYSWTGGRVLPPVAAGQAFFLPRFLHITLTVSLFLFGILLLSRRVTRMTNAKTTRELGLTRRTGT